MGTYRAVKIVYRGSFSDDRPYEREFAGIKRFEPLSRAHASQVDILHVGRNDAAGYFYYVMELADDAEKNRKPEGRSPKEVRRPEAKTEPLSQPIADSDFGIRSDFGLRDSALYTPRTLKLDLHRRGRLPFEECLDLALALTTALEHLHQNGLMHRDIKPANIIFVNGQPKLADIGLVTEVDATKSFVGTEGYIPPEGPTSPQADIYSLGKVLYEAATGRDRQDFPELPTDLATVGRERTAGPRSGRASRIANDRGPGRAPGLDIGLIELNEVILKACAAEPQQRYQSAAEMHTDLLLLKTGKSVKHTRRLERRLALVTRIGIVAGFAGLLAVAAFLYQKVQARRALAISQKELRLRHEADTQRHRAEANETKARSEAIKS
jgi:serine/threonine protein kinase